MQAMKNHQYIPKSLNFSFNPGKSVGAELYRLLVFVYDLSFSSLVLACLFFLSICNILDDASSNCNLLFYILCAKRNTILQKNHKKTITIRTMFRVVEIVAKQSAARSVGVMTTQRGYASAHGGRFKVQSQKTNQLTASNDASVVNSDTTVQHFPDYCIIFDKGFLKFMDLTETTYDKIREICFKIYLKIILLPLKFFRKLKKIYKGTTSDFQLTSIENTIMNMTKYYAIIIYDIIFNNLVLTKVYYLLPVIFIYNIIITIEKFYAFTKREEYDIACFFYIEKIKETTDNIYYANGHYIDKEIFLENFPDTKINFKQRDINTPDNNENKYK